MNQIMQLFYFSLPIGSFYNINIILFKVIDYIKFF